MTMSTRHCLLPWIVRHAAWTVKRYVIHSDGYTRFERRWKGTNSTETTTGLQIRPRTVEQSFWHTMGTTAEHLQPIVRNTVGYATTTVREKKVHARFRTTDERDGRHRCGTRNKTTPHYTTSTTSVYIDVKFTTTTG